MDYTAPKIPKPNFTAVLVALFFGVMVAIVLWQAQVRGVLPSNFLSQSKLPALQTQTIVQEENAVIDVVQNSSDSVIAIGVSKKDNSTIGTGFVVSEKGVIVTNKHVVSDTSVRYQIVTKDGQKYETKKIYKDPILDLALIQIDATGLKSLELGDSSKIRVGQTAIAIGNALGKFTNTVTTGVISGLGRTVTAGDLFTGSAESLDNLIQTDAAINPGNSGGPLLNSSGQVIGVNIATTEGAQNIGFAVPINAVKSMVDELLSTGTISRPFLGIRYRFISKDEAVLNEVPTGAFVQEVILDGPAQKAGINKGDMIIKINGREIDSENKVAEVVSKNNIGSNLLLEISRNGKTLELTAILQELPSQ